MSRRADLRRLVSAKNGLVVLWKLILFMGGCYLSLLILGGILVAVGFIAIGPRYRHLLRLIREPLMIAFSTASSEAAYPKTLEGLNRFGMPAEMIERGDWVLRG